MNDFQENLYQFPKITVITVVRNGYYILEKTILSVIGQNYSNIEYIIIDGASTDNTQDLIKQYNNKISHWISEPDKGIYDAMNKGIQIALGNYIIFMNAGDTFFDANVCNNVASILKSNLVDILYGDFIAHNEGNEIEVKAKPIEKIWSGMIFSHQSCLIKSELLKKFPFDLKYKIAADFNQILLLYTNNVSFHYLNSPISKITIQGISYSNINTYFEQLKIISKFRPVSFSTFYFISLIFFTFFKKLLGNRLVSFLRFYKWKLFRNAK